jgi:hypothetical protein
VIFFINLLLWHIIIIAHLYAVEWKGHVARMIHMRDKKCEQKFARKT